MFQKRMSNGVGLELIGIILFILIASISCGGGGGGGANLDDSSATTPNPNGIEGSWAGIMSPGFYIDFVVEDISGEKYITSASGEYVAVGCVNYMYTWSSDDLQQKIVNNECHIYFPDDLNFGDGRGMELHIYFDSETSLHGTWKGETFCEPLIDGTFMANHCTDIDKDGHLFCSFPTNTIPEDDCEDSNANVYRDAVEICDGLDNDCNGSIDDVDFMEGEEYQDQILLYPDYDEDGYGDASYPGRIICSDIVDGIPYVEDNSDCNDDDPLVNPDSVEICRNGIDDNCSGAENENCSPIDINVPGDFDTIQGAVDIAADGDTIFVSEGTYNENVDFKGKPITLQSVSGPEVTMIDGSKDGIRSKPAVAFNSCEDDRSIIDGFTITNGCSGISIGNTDSCVHSPSIKNCMVIDNGTNTFSAGMQTKGGGILILSNSSVLINNCIIAENNAHLGGGLYVEGKAQIINTTIVDNFANYSGGPQISYGGGIYYAGSPDTVLTAVNSIVWGNEKGPCGYDLNAGKVVCTKSQIDTTEDSYFAVSYSDVEGGFTGISNINFDPLINATYHLQLGSPCIDAGTDDKNAYPNLPTTDIEGEDRPQGTGFDIGSDEYLF